MKQNIKKKDFLELCDALEEGIITLEQFYILSDKKLAAQKFILYILKMLNKEDNNETFNAICASKNYFELYEILIRYPVYRTDDERRKLIFENQDNKQIMEIASLLKNDFIWNNKKLVQLIIDSPKKDLEYKEQCERRYIYSNINSFVSSNTSLFNDKRRVELLEKIFTLNTSDKCKIFLHYLKIESLTKDNLWFDYLISHYNRNRRVANYSICFEAFEEAKCMEKLTNKLKEIDNSSNNDATFDRFFANIVTIGIPVDMDDQQKNRFQKDFDILLDYVTDDTDDFYCIKVVLEIVDSENLSDDEIKKIYNNLRKCKYENVRSLIENIYRNGQKEILDDETMEQVSEMAFDDAKRVLLERSISINATNYIMQEREYYEEILPDSFTNYISIKKLTKEELLEIRDKVKNSDSTFNGERFVVNTESYIVENTTDEEQSSTQKTANLTEQQKEKTLRYGTIGRIKQFFTKNASNT